MRGLEHILLFLLFAGDNSMRGFPSLLSFLEKKRI